jgi:YVTN family beta-propeller protein
MKRTRKPIVAAALAVALASTAGAAVAAPPSTPASTFRSPTVTAADQTELATGLLSPLRMALGRGNSVYVTQNFGGQLTSVQRDGTLSTLVDRPGIEIGGVSTHHGSVYFTESAGGPGSPDPFVANVGVIEKSAVRVLADLAALESANNYDAGNSYGFQDLSDACSASISPELAPLVLPRGGDTYSHPYATAVSNSGRYVYVADAGANTVFTVDTRHETVSAKVLSPVATLVTQELLTALAGQGVVLPDCVIGATFNAEPVPTDIELGGDGLLYLTLLPGGPEDPNLGSVRRFDPRTGTVDVVASGLTSPTGLALDRRGNIFVAELFAGRISVIPAGTSEAVPLLDAVLPADVEVDGQFLYATTKALPSGPEASGVLVRARLDYGRK